MVESEFHELTIKELYSETRDAVCVTLDVPESIRSRFQYKQGQYLTLRLTIDGDETRRSYSICSGVSDDVLKIAIKRIDGGRFSTYANTVLRIGDIIEAMPPEGDFYTELNPSNSKYYLFIAAGSGITPVLSNIKSTLAIEAASHVTLIYGNQYATSIMFRDELDRLKNRYMQRFQLTHVLSREQRDPAIFSGRIDKRKSIELCQNLLDLECVDEVFLCGPEAMISEVSRGLRGVGVDEMKIHYELFGASAVDAATSMAKHHARARKFGGKLCEVTIKADGREITLALPPDGENILDAALVAGLDLPFACKGGACATCKAKLLAGEVEMDVRHALDEEEVELGYVLTCQAHPVSDRVLIDFDRPV